MKMRRFRAVDMVCALCICVYSMNAVLSAQVPDTGAQIWISPDDKEADIDGWFSTLENGHMRVARLFMMWPYIEKRPNVWDFTLYDWAFQSAEKHHIRIIATLTPSGFPTFRGGDGSQGTGLPRSAQQWSEALVYLNHIVKKYESSPALDSWLLINEPGERPHATPLALKKFRSWLTSRYATIDLLNSAWGTNFSAFATVAAPEVRTDSWDFTGSGDWYRFWREYQTGQLQSLASAVRRVDSSHPLHANPHALLSNLSEVSDDLPAWKKFLDSLGCSIHPAWHFGLLRREDYSLGVSYVNDIVRGSIEPKPYWVTELQGGNNTYSAKFPMEPTASEIAQWMWIDISAGAKRTIFWLLNARPEGRESGEWSLLNFDGKPSARFVAAAQIQKQIDQHEGFFHAATPELSKITILLNMDTMSFDAVASTTPAASGETAGRGENSTVAEAFGIYKAISMNSTPPQVKFFDDFKWDSNASAERRAVIVPDARVLSQAEIDRLTEFARQGNTVIVTGLSGFYDAGGGVETLKSFPLQRLTGARLLEMHTISAPTKVRVGGNQLPVNMWMPEIETDRARPTARDEQGRAVASEMELPGGGKVIWVPALIGIPLMQGATSDLAKFLQQSLTNSTRGSFTISGETGCLIRVMKSGENFLTIVANTTTKEAVCKFSAPDNRVPSESLADSAPARESGMEVFHLAPMETSVILWK